MKNKQSVFLMLGIALAACGLVVLALGLYYRNLNQHFADEGMAAEAVVAVKKIEKNDDKDDRFLLQLTYPDSAQRPTNGWVVVSREKWDAMSEGGTIPVQYLKSKPTEMRLADPQTMQNGAVQIRLAAIAGVLAAFAFGIHMMSARRSLAKN